MYNNKLFSFLSILFLALILSSTTSNAQHYWVAGSGNWNDYATHWATSSGGSSFHSSSPTATDNVFFDSNSFTAIGQVVSFTDVDNYCNSFDLDAVLYQPLFQMNEESTLRINGSMDITNEATYNFSAISMESTGSGNHINTNGQNLGSESILNIIGAGDFSLSSTLDVEDMYLYEGTFNSANHEIIIGFSFEILGDLTKTLNLGSSDFSCGVWKTQGTNNTINTGTSTILTRHIFPDIDNSGPYFYANVKFKNTGFKPGLISGSGTFGNIDVTLLGQYNFRILSGSTITVDEIITTEDIHNPVIFEITYWDEGENITIEKSSGTLNLSYVEMGNVHATGGATFNVNPGIDMGNNDGWNFTEITPVEYYWVNDGGDWLDVNHWSTTSGGSANQPDYPSKYDNTTFDINSFSSAGQIVLASSAIQANNILWTDDVNSPTFNTSNTIEINGNLYFSDMVNLDLTTIYFIGDTSSSIRTSNQGEVELFYFTGTGTFSLESDIVCEIFSLREGVFNSNNYDISATNLFSIFFGNDKVVNLGTSEIICGEYSVNCNSCEINAMESTITVSSEFRGGQNRTYNHLIYDGEAIAFHNTTLNTLEFKSGATVQFYNGTEITINDELIIDGIPSQPVTLHSYESGIPFTFIKTSGTVNANYLILQDNIATGGATFNALQSIDNGGNTGWNIEALEPLNYYWVGNGGDWSDNANHWATTSGGNTFHNYPPGTLDYVYFDANSFSTASQIVEIDEDNVYCFTMDWSTVTNSPIIEGEDKTVNCYGSLIFGSDMDVNVTDFHFLGTGANTIDPGFEDSPGLTTSFRFSNGGTWDITNPLTLENFYLEEGIVNTNNHDVHCFFYTMLTTNLYKELNLGTSNFYSYHFGFWGGSNGMIDAGEANLFLSGEFTPVPFGGIENEVVTYNNVHFVQAFSNSPIIYGSCELNELTINPGLELSIYSGETVTVNQLYAEGTSTDHIIIKSTEEGIPSTIHQAIGTVDGQYLELQDNNATGDATFYANNSIDLGNVTGWIFTNVQQSINFPIIEDVLEDIGTIILTATASSGLEITYGINYGPATIDGNTITITGPGEIQVTASQSGDDLYAAAVDQSQNFCSTPLTPEISSTYYEDYVTLTVNSSQQCIWYRNGVIIENTPTVSIDVFQTGIYTAQRTTSNCASELSNEINISVISVDEIENIQSLNFYPNPAYDKINILTPENGRSDIKIFNLYGGLVSQLTIIDSSNKKSIVDISNLSKGVYFIKLTTEKKTYGSKLIKE